jgi:predicted glycoside hydrolase/deacetylase ChbG (UPF0249 family)
LPPLRHVLRRALARELPVAELNAEIDQQIAAFMEAFGRTPDFIDGHHHVHLLPVVRDLVVEKVAALSARSPMYLRSCLEPIWVVLGRRVAVSRTLAVTMLARSLARRAQRANISTNDSFRGINNFNTGARFGAEFRRFLQGSGRRPLIMCHPGHPDRELAARDRVVDQRAFELAYLLSDSFLTDLTTSRTRVARFGAMPEFDVPEPLHEL